MFFDRAPIATLLLLCTQVHAQRRYDEMYGDPTARGFIDNATRPRFEQAIKNPNATRSFKFDPLRSWSAGFNQDPVQWTWRVNVSTVSVPGALPKGNDFPLTDPYITTITHDLSWPDGGKVPHNATGPTGPGNVTFCAIAQSAIDFPANVTNLYTEAHLQGDSTKFIDPYDCTRALGQECVTETLKNHGARFSDSGCSGRIEFDSPKCWGTTGRNPLSLASKYPGWMSTNLTRADSGEVALAAASSAYNGSDPSGYFAASNMLHIMRMSIKVDTSFGTFIFSQLLCMRINTTKLPIDMKWDKNGDGILLTGEAAIGVNAGVSGYGTSSTAKLLILAVLLWSMY